MFGVLGMAAIPAFGQSVDLYADWRARHLDVSGRVVDRQQGSVAHSEGQGYGLLLAQAFGDRDAFERIEAWTERHLATRRDRLMGWKWTPGQSGRLADWRNATDGDLFRAWALLRAERDSGWGGYGEKALVIARDIAALCLAPDPRAPDQPLLMPGAEAARGPDRVSFNPSYVMPRALRELGDAAAEPRLVRAADHGQTVLAELAATGFLPNWVDVTPEGFARSPLHDWKWGYDAIRVPLYLIWSGRRDHPAVALSASLMGHAQPRVVVERDGDGGILATSDRRGFVALRELRFCLSRPAGRLDGDYYADTLLLLTMVAAREAQCRT